MTLDDALARYPGAVSFRFGDSAALNSEILALVRSGDKTATCDAWDAFAARNEPLPQVGRIDIATDWDGAPALAIRTCAVDRIRFCDMREADIPAQGEFIDLSDWRRGYEAYLRRSGWFDPEVPMLLERFEVVEDFAVQSDAVSLAEKQGDGGL